MFTFIRDGLEPEMHMEDYAVYYADTNEPFALNDYYDDEGYDRALYPVVSINRRDYCIELYNFFDDEVLPSDIPKIYIAIIELVNLKDELDINNYMITGDGADMYRKIYSRPFI